MLVVGAANSGAQLALQLARFRNVWLAGRSIGRIPRRPLGRDRFARIWPIISRASLDTRLGRRIHASAVEGGDALIRLSERDLTDAGVVRVGRVTGQRGGLPVPDGIALQPRTVVWATGFAPNDEWIALPVTDDRGARRHRRAVAIDRPDPSSSARACSTACRRR